MITMKEFLRRMKRQERIINKICIGLPWLSVGIVWFFVLPSPDYSRRTYISENALLPGLPFTRFNDEHAEWVVSLTSEIDTVIARIEREFHQLGLSTGQQPVHPTFYSNTSSMHQPATNIYGILDGQRADHSEALVLAAPWFSVTGQSNARGIAMMLALAKVFKSLTIWAKDVIFVIPAGEQGQIEWLAAYHNTTGLPNLWTGAIQAAIVLDLPITENNRYDILQIEFMGVNGQLPNLDVMNTISRISNDDNISVILENEFSVTDYTITYMIWKQASGRPTNIHGYYHPYKIDAVTISSRMIPNSWGIDQRQLGVVIESVFRSFNNLLEHFHQSFFFYLMQSNKRFISIANYLPPLFGLLACLLFSISFMRWKAIEAIKALQTDKEKSNDKDQDLTVLSSASWTAINHFVTCLVTGVLVFNIPSPEPYPTSYGETEYYGMPSYVAAYTVVNVTMLLWTRYSYNYFVVADSNNVNAPIVTPTVLLLAHRRVNSEPYTMKGFRLVQFIILLLISPPGLLFVGKLFGVLSMPSSIIAHLANDYTRAGIMVYPFFCFCYHPAISALLLSL
ncbi:Gaa1-like protein [Syncephalis plumigaleata]|nr:Gaa1-like protein [Syncephalis plumigaleata]